jgi:hypothetical protein
MSLEILSEDLLNYIWTFIGDNKTSINFLISNKYIYSIGYKFGYVKSMHIGGISDDNIVTCIIRYTQHMNSLYYMHIENVENPHLWIGGSWPKYTTLDRCTFTDSLVDPAISKTQVLSIYYYEKNPIELNWKKFPNLKHIIK